MSKTVNPALHPEALYAKSQVYISKGLRAKRSGELDEYQLWASLALELLAKSSLSSSIHPALIADPQHYQSLFAACGHPLSPDIKTITAKTLFPRLTHVSKRFDTRVQKFCEQLSLRRNSELHSGESPFSGMKTEAWEKKYWHAIAVILEIQEKGLEQWLGAEDSKAPKQILENTDAAIKMAVQTRISHAREDFETAHKNIEKRAEYVQNNECTRVYSHRKEFDINIDSFELSDCPSCGAKGVLGGMFWEEEVCDEIDQDDPFVEYVDKIYLSEEFLCKVCGLHLLGFKEIEASPLPEEFHEFDERKREFEPDYGND
uniref:Uncharacterized protein n=1 Tax=Candidatus Kentrum sp. LFY TaxID=2126342 RepID=A0A450UN04_9GAMM|nr:MAG: hypothetical protein BECKLFY1418A_GA0070994_103520 [Candidatus Kentron sp. LFY]